MNHFVTWRELLELLKMDALSNAIWYHMFTSTQLLHGTTHQRLWIGSAMQVFLNSLFPLSDSNEAILKCEALEFL